MKNLEDELLSDAAMYATADQIERLSIEQGQALLRELHQAHLDRRTAREQRVTVRGANGIERERVHLSSRRLDFDAFYVTRAAEPEAMTHLLILKLRRQGIAMRHADLRHATRKAAEAESRRLHTRLAKGEKPNRKRMAQVATVYTLAPWPHTSAEVLHRPSARMQKSRTQYIFGHLVRRVRRPHAHTRRPSSRLQRPRTGADPERARAHDGEGQKQKRRDPGGCVQWQHELPEVLHVLHSLRGTPAAASGRVAFL